MQVWAHISGLLTRVPQRLLALLEQAALSGANFLAFIWFARQLAPAEWGEFGFAYALALFMQGFQRAIVTIPMIPFSAEAGGWSGARATWVRVHSLVQLACLLSLALAALAATFWNAGWLSRSLWMAATLLPPLFLHEFARRCAIQEQRFDVLLTMGIAYFLTVLFAAAWMGHRGLGGWAPTIGVVLGGLAALAAYGLAVRRRLIAAPAGRQAMPAGLGNFAGWSVLSHLGFSGYNFGVLALLGAVAGPAAVGVFHACRTLIQPVATIIGAMDSVDKPKAAAALRVAGLSGMRAVLGKSLLTILAIGMPYLLLVAVAADDLLSLAYRDQYLGQGQVVLMWCLVAVGMMVSHPVESGLYVCRRTQAMFFSRMAAAVVGLAAALPLARQYGPAGALAAMAMAYTITAGLGGALLMRRSAKAT